MGERADELTARTTGSREVFGDTREPISPLDDDSAPAAERDRDQTEDTAEIRADIEQTRAAMSETIDSMKERLAPQNLVEQAKDAATGKYPYLE